MAATLTWASSGLGTKTGTAVGNLFSDLVTLINSKSGDSTFSWQVASSNVASTPYQITLKPKSGAAGRILLVMYTSAPAGTQPVLFDAAPVTDNLFLAWFPSGNVDTPSNLSAASGTVMGNDTDAVKVSAGVSLANIYATSVQAFYFDSAEAVYFGFQNPGAAACFWCGAGNLVVDASDNAYGATFGYATAGAANFGSTTPQMVWVNSGSKPLAGQVTNACVRTNYSVANSVFYQAFSPSGPWATSVVNSTDIMSDTTINTLYFAPQQLLGQTKGQGLALKLRQIAMGSGTVGPFQAYNTTGPVVQARQFNASTTGGNGYPWFTNFKV